jgi:hypothetical protein
MEFDEKWESDMKVCLEEQRKENYKLISQQPIHPELKNSLRNLVDNWVDSVISTQEQRAALHRWSESLQKVHRTISINTFDILHHHVSNIIVTWTAICSTKKRQAEW